VLTAVAFRTARAQTDFLLVEEVNFAIAVGIGEQEKRFPCKLSRKVFCRKSLICTCSFFALRVNLGVVSTLDPTNPFCFFWLDALLRRRRASLSYLPRNALGV